VADANRVVDAMTKQLGELMKQAIIAQVEVEELREKIYAMENEKMTMKEEK